MFICQLCKREFEKSSSLTAHLKRSHNGYDIKEYYDKFIKKENEGICRYCGSTATYYNFVKGYNDICSNISCASKKRSDVVFERYGVKSTSQLPEVKEKAKKTNLKKYGVEYTLQSKEIREKGIQTCLKRYGKEHYTQTEEYLEKVEQTCLEKYGVDHHLKSEEIKEKRKETNLENWGVENVFQSEEIKEKIGETNLEKYGVINVNHSEEIKAKRKKTYRNKYGSKGHMTKEQRHKQQRTLLEKKYNEITNKEEFTEAVKPLFEIEDYWGYANIYPWECLKCKKTFSDNLLNQKIPRCPDCNPPSTSYSFAEKELYSFINNYISCEENTRFYIYKQSYYELDIYIPEISLGIEFNGNYYHSELSGKDKKYHINKTNFFKEKGIQVIHIFESEWKVKQKIVKSMLLSKIGKIENKIYARKCEIKEVSFIDKNEFLNENHIQGTCSSFLNLGLYYNNELVSLMTFGKSRYSNKYDYELLRFCNKLNTTIVGGFSKLLKQFEKEYKGILVSYADLRFSCGNVYEKNNFKLNNISLPNYFYFSNSNKLKLYNRIQFQKHKLKKILETFDEKLTEWENMKNNNYDRIWDCGNLVYTKEIKKE